MKLLTKKLISLFKREFELLPKHRREHLVADLVAGYSPPDEDLNSREIVRKPVGILYADIADYTRLSEEDEEGTHRRLIECMEIIRAEIAANSGRVSHSSGDAILAEFSNAETALRCAANVQLASRRWNAGLDFSRQVRFRIGVNYGDVIADQGDIYGKEVNLTARLEGLACSGGICVSKSVQAELADRPDFEFIALGKRYVKNISEPIEVFWIEVSLPESGPQRWRTEYNRISVPS